MRLLRLALVFSLAAVCLGAQKKSAPKPDQATGCIDEQAGPEYVLRGDERLLLIARLQAEGFKPEIFAQYLGNKVTVTGRLDRSSNPPVFHVRRIERLAASCRPDPQAAPPPAGESGGERQTATGCIDEQPGPRYVLRGDQQLRLLMHLEPEGFAVENFARYLGTKVRVQGRVRQSGETTVMRVREIEKIAGSCRSEQ